MGEAAKISLKAIGKQDTHLLSKDPEDSFFNYKNDKIHSDFRKYHRSRNVINPGAISGWPFGQTIKVQFNPQNMGDLLSNMWLSITIPRLTDFGGGKNYADQLGRHILKSVTMFVDELEVETIHDDWGIIYDELYLEISEKDISIVESDLKPTASVSLEKSYTDDLSSTIGERDKDILKATVSWPFSLGGKNKYKVNKNTNLTTRKRLLLDHIVRTNETNVASAWSNMEASKSFLNSIKVQLKSSKIANEGIAAEYERGSRTTLDVIQSNSLLLSAQLSLVSSERNYLMAQYNLLKAVGLLNSQYLKLK